MNFLAETKRAINLSGHVPSDIVFIGSVDSGHACTWDEFLLLADFDYDCGFGAQEVPCDLIIAFSDGSTMWRHEYDGSERWDYSVPFKMPEETLPIVRLYYEGSMWPTLEDVQKPGGKYGKDND